MQIKSSTTVFVSFFFYSTKNTNTYLISVADASAKIPSGILEGTAMEFGAYEECLDIRVQASSRNSTTGRELFRGQYCTLALQHSLMSSTHKEEPPEIVSSIKFIFIFQNIFNMKFWCKRGR